MGRTHQLAKPSRRRHKKPKQKNVGPTTNPKLTPPPQAARGTRQPKSAAPRSGSAPQTRDKGGSKVGERKAEVLVRNGGVLLVRRSEEQGPTTQSIAHFSSTRQIKKARGLTRAFNNNDFVS